MLKYLLASLLFSTAALSPSFAAPDNQRYTVVETAKSQLAEHTLSFTVKLSAGQFLGSGTLLAKKGSTYLVLTNRHVIDGKSSVAVQTHDGQTHQATVIDDTFPDDYDLALLSFNSDLKYQLPRIASFTPKVDQVLFTAGYHAELRKFQSNQTLLKQVLPTNRSLKQGYQLGYGSMIHQGMSGGPIIEASGDEPSGELIGINGRSAHPVVNNYTRVDGTAPTSEELEQLRQLNWGIPINTILSQIKPELLLAYRLPPPIVKLKLAKPNWTGWLKDLENKAKQFTVRVDNQATGGNGSGVIVAKEGNTYTVLTAEHVLDQKGENHQFSVLTHDGESHVINAKNIRRQPGVDLASFQFESEVNYPVATLANYPRTESDVVFVAGFPKVGQESPQWLMSGGTIYEEEQGRFNISNTSITSHQQGAELAPLASLQASFAQGYDMVYTSITYRGMSGGPVLDSEGRVVGIHGQAEGEPAEDSSQSVIQLGNSLGIPTGTAMAIAERLGMKERQINLEIYKSSITDAQKANLQKTLLTVEVPLSNASPAIWIQRGDQLRRLGRLEEALEVFNRSIKMSHDDFSYLHLAHFGKAEILRKQGDFQGAVASLKIALDHQPSYTPAWYLLSGNYRLLKQFGAALRAIDQAIQQKPDNENLYNEKSVVLRSLERSQDALVSINQALKLSRRATFYSNRGIIFTNLKDYPKAIEDHNKAIEINPNGTFTYNNRGYTLFQMEEYPKAIENFSKAIEIDPNDTFAYYARGYALNKLKEYPRAIEDLNKVIEINPNYADAYNIRGNIFKELKEYLKAIENYGTAVEINPSFAIAYYNRGNTFKEMKDYPKALENYSKAIALNPNLAETYVNRGIIFREMEDYPKALKDYNRAIAIEPSEAAAYNNRGLVFFKMKDFPKALEDINKAIALNPNLAETYLNRGVVFSEMKDYPKAFEAFNKVIEIDPKNVVAYRSRGHIFREMKDYPKALEDYNRAIEIDPYDVVTYSSRGFTFGEMSDYHKALADFDKAIELNPNLPKTYGARGLIFSAMRDYPKAIADFSKAIELNPNLAEPYSMRGLSYLQNSNIAKARQDLKTAATLYKQQGNMMVYEELIQLLEKLEAQ